MAAQGHPRKFPVLQEKRQLFALPSPITCKARLSTFCSRKSDEERPSISDHDSPLLSQFGLFRQPCLHISHQSRVWLPLDPGSPFAAIRCKPIKAQALSVSAGRKGERRRREEEKRGGGERRCEALLRNNQGAKQQPGADKHLECYNFCVLFVALLLTSFSIFLATSKQASMSFVCQSHPEPAILARVIFTRKRR